jgi:Uma2 family endonuclease
LIGFLERFLDTHDLGIVLGPDGTLRILSDQIRVPDVAFLRRRYFPNRVLPAEPVPALAPDLAVEVLSDGNTEAEMDRKLDDYFTAGVKLVWVVDPSSKSAEVYNSRDCHRTLSLNDTLDGETVLPGFMLPELFDKAGHRSGR